MPEHDPNNEYVRDDSAVIAALRGHSGTPETKEVLLLWTLAREAEVEAENTSRAAIVFNIRRAKLYEQAGFVSEALENYQDAQYQAEQEGEGELVAECLEGIQRLEKV